MVTWELQTLPDLPDGQLCSDVWQVKGLASSFISHVENGLSSCVLHAPWSLGSHAARSLLETCQARAPRISLLLGELLRSFRTQGEEAGSPGSLQLCKPDL